MASFALGGLGTSFGTPVVGFVGAAVGAVIDQVAINALFPNEPDKSAKASDLRTPQVRMGSPKNRCLGQKCRVKTGTIIWRGSTTIRYVDVGGGGGLFGGDEVLEPRYQPHLAYGICLGPEDGSGVEAVSEAWFKDRIFYNGDGVLSFTSNQIFVTAIQIGSGALLFGTQVRIKSTQLGPNLRNFRSNVPIDVSGFSNPDYNGTFNISYKLDGEDGVTILVMEPILGLSLAGEAIGNSITLTQNTGSEDPNFYNGIEVFQGTSTQPTSTIMADDGIVDLQTYRYNAVMIFDEFKVARTGNQIPQDIDFVIVENSGRTVAEAINIVVTEWAGIDSQYIDVTEVDNEPFLGITVPGDIPPKQVLLDIMLAYNIYAQRRDGIVFFMSRANLCTIDLDISKVSAQPFDSSPIGGIDFQYGSGTSLHRKVIISYPDFDQHGAEDSVIERTGDSGREQIKRFETPCVLTNELARKLANRLLWLPLVQDTQVKIQVPPSLSYIRENDILQWTANDVDHEFLVTRVDGDGESRTLTAIRNDIIANDITPAAQDAPDDNAVIETGVATTLQVVDIAPIFPGDEATNGAYLGACLSDFSVDFIGMSSFLSVNGGSTYSVDETLIPEARIGVIQSDVTAGSHGLYSGQQIEVEMLEGSLTTISDTEIVEGLNLALIGQTMIIQFKTVVTQIDRTFTITDILFHERGTLETQTLVAGNTFMVLEKPLIRYREYSESEFGQSRKFKAVAAGGDIDDYTEVDVTYAGSNRKLFSPAALNAQRVNSGDWKIRMRLRTRSTIDAFGTSQPDNGDGDTLELDVMNGLVATALSPLTPLSTSDGWYEVTYTVANQISDFGSAQSTINLEAYHIHSDLGRSNKAAATFS